MAFSIITTKNIFDVILNFAYLTAQLAEVTTRSLVILAPQHRFLLVPRRSLLLNETAQHAGCVGSLTGPKHKGGSSSSSSGSGVAATVLVNKP